MKTIRLTSGLRVAGMLFVLMAGAVLQGCGGGGSSTPAPTPTADPTGYYDVTGTASVGDGSGGTLTITDMEAMVSNNRMMMMSVANNLLYDITITNISGNDFTGNVVVYTDGQIPTNATVSGTITSGSSITGVLQGSGAGSGNFTLNYMTQKTQIPNTPFSWYWNIGGSTLSYGINSDGKGGLTNVNTVTNGYFTGCTMNGTITEIGSTGVYKVSVTIANCSSDSSFNGDYTGFAAAQDMSAITLPLAITKSDGTRSVSEDFSGA